MYAADIIFHCKPVDVDDPLYHQIDWGMSNLLSAWQRNGQIAPSDFSIVELEQGYTVRVMLPESDSLTSGNDSARVDDALANLHETPLRDFEVRLVGQVFDIGPVCQCAQPASFVLFGVYKHVASAIRCGNCFQPVPLYKLARRIPWPTIPPDYYDAILAWQEVYTACDDLNIADGALSQQAITEMSLPDSNLSQEGREICRNTEQLTTAPTYYYLYRDKGESLVAERERKCPVCGGEWLLPEKWHLFDFKCDRDRLVSNIAYDLETEDGD